MEKQIPTSAYRSNIWKGQILLSNTRLQSSTHTSTVRLCIWPSFLGLWATPHRRGGRERKKGYACRLRLNEGMNDSVSNMTAITTRKQ